MEKVIVVIGPTSVGKTKMGVALAKKFNGEVISGDSMQIYKQMDIGTAKVTEEEKEGIIHHCVDIHYKDKGHKSHRHLKFRKNFHRLKETFHQFLSHLEGHYLLK